MPSIFEKNSFLTLSNQSRAYQFISVSQQATDFFRVLPVLNIEITERADLSIAKTLGGNFNVVVFQDMPVAINIVGIYTLGADCNISDEELTQHTIQDLYTKYKVGNEQGNMLTVTINGISYDVMATSLVQSGANQMAQGFMSYTLTMIGSKND